MDIIILKEGMLCRMRDSKVNRSSSYKLGKGGEYGRFFWEKGYKINMLNRERIKFSE